MSDLAQVSGYAGAGYVASLFKKPMSDLGVQAANLLGDLYAGIYHLSRKSLTKVEWNNPTWVQIIIYGDLSTFDFDTLTRLVVLAHDRCIRVEISGVGPGYIKIGFSPRAGRDGPVHSRHPTIEDAVASIRASYAPRQID